MRALMALSSTLLLLGLQLGAVGCSKEPEAGAAAGASTAEKPENVRVLEVAPTDLDEWLIVTGRLRADRATDVSCEESGVVETIAADKGAAVRQGDLLVELDRRMLEAERKSAEAAATLREYNEDRTRTLYDEHSVSKQEMLKVHTEREQAAQQAEIARLRYERAAVTAPFDGVVVDRYVELGQLVNQGQAVVRLVDPSVLELEAYATEAEVAALRVGAPALVAVTGVDEPVWAAVSWVSVEAQPTSGKFGLEIRIDNADLRLRAGVLATARVLVRRHEKVLAIPRDAVTEGPTGPQVFVAKDGRAVAHPVRLGADQGMMVVARSGLEAGEELIVRGQRDVVDGSRVEITERSERRDGSLDSDPPEVREEGTLTPPLDMRGERGLGESDGAR